jgi:hypothetical protein
MMKNRNIRSLEELHAEVNRLKTECIIKEDQLLIDTKSFIKTFSPMSLVKRFVNPQGLFKLDEKTNISGNIMSLILPFIVNKTVFRGSGLITKAISALVSRKVGKSLDAEHLTELYAKVKSWFSKKETKEKTVEFADYGIPPDSETY